MVNYSPAEGSALISQQDAKVRGQRQKAGPEVPQAESEVRKGGLVDQIKEICAAQWPRWIVLSARTDKRSGLPLGCHDMTIFASGGRVFYVELKAKGNKLDPDQLIWKKELEMLGTIVHVIYSVGEFKKLTGL